jgi:MFS superfamily sulfate permease-like transporter
MAKRLAIQRGEDIRTDQELLGLGIASVVCGFLRAMPPTGGMSRTAVNLQNAKTQLASIITVGIIILSLYTLTGTLYYLPKSTLSAIIIVAGYSLVEFKEAKWLYRIKRDEFYVWTASFILTLGLGVMYGLAASIASSIIGLMWKTKRSPVVILGELDNGTLVDREQYTEAKHLTEVVVLRVENSLYFANCERMVVLVDDELARLGHEGAVVKGVVLDVFNLNDLDATTLEVLSDLQQKLSYRKIGFAVANAKGKIHDIIASTNLIKRLAGQNPRAHVDDAIRFLTNWHAQASLSTSTLPDSDRAATSV